MRTPRCHCSCHDLASLCPRSAADVRVTGPSQGPVCTSVARVASGARKMGGRSLDPAASPQAQLAGCRTEGPAPLPRGERESARGTPRSCGAGGGALSSLTSSSLDKWTNCDTGAGDQSAVPAYRMMYRDFGEGEVEATVTVAAPPRKRSRSPASTAEDPRRIVENRKRAHARARTTIRRTIMAARLDHLLTLTYRENIQDEKGTWRDFTKFIRLLRGEHQGRPWPYIAVQELQKRGAVHFHVAVCGFQDVVLLRRVWHHVIGGPDRGNIDVRYFVGPKAKLARYLAKYVSKDITRESANGLHRYKRSRGIRVPGQILLLPPAVNLDAELRARFEGSGAEIKFQKDSLHQEGPKWRWACSW